MYVYVTKFEGKPHLLKIGKSSSPDTRNATLAKSHGGIVYSDHYKIGGECSSVEKYLHSRYSLHKNVVEGDGGTEFFSDIVYKDVSNYLDKYVSEGSELWDRDYLEGQIKREKRRYYNLIGKLLGHKHSSTHTGESYSHYEGMWDIIRIDGCYNLGFTTKEIADKYIARGIEQNILTRFTTPGRIEMAYHLSRNGSAKGSKLNKLLKDLLANERELLS